jgi:hypothetical protein
VELFFKWIKQHLRIKAFYGAQYSEWWRNPLAERREQTSDLSIEPVFFRIDIESMSGLGAVP